jgi:hypothetical protein
LDAIVYYGQLDLAVAEEGTRRLEAWLAALGAPRRLPWSDCPPDDLDLVVGDVHGRAMARDNPRASSAGDLRQLVASSIAGW